jgi:two-component system, NarL family, sensor histidine kinase LiaS
MISGSDMSDSMRLRLTHVGKWHLNGDEWGIYLYRFVSLMLTFFLILTSSFVLTSSLTLKSSAYLMSASKTEWMILLFLLFESIIVSGVLIRVHESPPLVRILLMMETIILGVLVAQTGGVKSPFVWLALNPVLSATTLVNPFYGWATMMGFVLTAIGSWQWLFPQPQLSAYGLLEENLTMMLVFVFMTLAVLLYSRFAEQVSARFLEFRARRQELAPIHRELGWTDQGRSERYARERTLTQDVIALYQSVQGVTSQDDLGAVGQVLADYLFTLTNHQTSFVWILPNEHEELEEMDSIPILKTHPEHVMERDRLLAALEQLWVDTRDVQTPVTAVLAGTKYLLVTVRSSSTRFALMGHDVCSGREGERYDEAIDPLAIVADVSARILERRRLEKTAQQLLVVEEQNRIANEMHDNVSQQLFSIVYASHALKQSWVHFPADQVQNQLNVISETAHAATQEFRQIVLQLSNRPSSQWLHHRLEQYLHEVRELNQISLETNIDGCEQSVPPSMKPAIYRIVAEAVGNAIRHGQCTEVSVRLRFGDTTVEMEVSDNGCGFNAAVLVQRKASGLGLQNMTSIAQRYAGDFRINSAIGKGTAVRVELKHPQMEFR